MPARVLVVDDMAIYRSVIAKAIEHDPQLEVVGKAVNGADALEKIEALDPDLVTLDLEMPEMTGLEVLYALKAKAKKPRCKVVVFSAQSVEGAEITLRALNAGAADFVLKPTASQGAKAIEENLIPRLRSLHQATESMPALRRLVKRHQVEDDAHPIIQQSKTGTVIRRQLLVIASSTGGPPALEAALRPFSADFPVPVIIVQHMPAMFTATMSANLDRLSALKVSEAQHGDVLKPGHAYVAPGDYHLQLLEDDGQLVVQLDQGERIYGLRPAADVTLNSIGRLSIDPDRVVTCVLTGMGQDGLEGCRPLHARGMVVLTQCADSCVVYGMPKAIDDAGLSHGHLTPDVLHAKIKEFQWHWPR